VAHFAKELPRALPRMHKAGDYRTSYRDQWRHFHQCIRSGTPVEATLQESKSALAAMLAAMESAETRRVVPVPDFSTPA
jgi:predicted dehydrogenase